MINGMDHTENIKKRVTRENCLVMADPIFDLGLCLEVHNQKKNKKKRLGNCENWLYLTYQYGNVGPLVSKCLQIHEEYPFLITFNQKLQEESMSLIDFTEINKNFNAKLIGVFVDNIDITKEAINF